MGKDKDTFEKLREGGSTAVIMTSTTGAGATIGSFVLPGIGTAIGAMIGCAVGGVAVIVHKSKENK